MAKPDSHGSEELNLNDWLVGLSRRVSLLRNSGHPEPAAYPLPTLVFESDMVEARINSQEATRAVLLQGAISSILSKDGLSEFRRTIDKLTKP